MLALPHRSPAARTIRIVAHRSILLVNKHLHTGGAAGGVGQYLLQEKTWLDAAGWSTIPFGVRDGHAWGDVDADLLVRGHDYSRVRLDRHVVGAAASLLWNREAARNLSALIRRRRPDVAHLHNIYHHLSPSILPVLRYHGIPTVMTLHDLRLLCPAIHLPDADGNCARCLTGHYLVAVRKRCVHGSRPASLLAAAETWHQRTRRLYRRHVDLFLCPSETVVTLFAKHGYPSRQLRHLPNAIDLTEWRPATEAAAPAAAYAYFGRLSPEKDLRTLLRAHAAWQATGTPLRLIIIGDGPQRTELEAEARRLQLRDITFTGYLSAAAIRQVLAGVRFTILPSTCHENRPLAVLESLASGIPVVASRVGGLPEIVRDDDTGFLFRPGDSADLLVALRRGEQSEPRHRRACRVWAEAHADLRRHMAELTDILMAAAASRRP